MKQIGEYYIITNDFIGQGQYGKVFKCYKNNIKEELYCMKILQKPNNSQDAKIKNTLEAELKIFSLLRHKHSENLVKLIDYIEHNNELCLIMELCDCDLNSLFDKYQLKNQWFTRQEQSHMIRQILKGAQSLKENKIVHRDIKPQNILVKILNPNQNDEIRIYKIADFGFSKSLNDMYEPQNMTRLGTLNYVAPEIYQKIQFSGKCDIYSYGILFHQIVFQRRFPVQYNSREQLNQFFEQIKKNPYKCQILEDQEGKLLTDLIEKMILFDQNERLSFEDLLLYEIMLLNDPLFKPISQINKFQIINEDNQKIFLRIYTILDNLYRKSLLCKSIVEKLKKFNSQNNINILKIQYSIQQIGFCEIKFGFAMIHLIISDFLPKIVELCDVPHFINLLKLYLKEENPKQLTLHQKIKNEFYSQQRTLTEEISNGKLKIYQINQQQLIEQQIEDEIFTINTVIEKQQIKVLCQQLSNLLNVKETCEIISSYDIELLKKIKEIPTIESRFDFFEYKLYKSDQILKI